MRRYLTEVVAQDKLELIPELAAEDMEDHTNDTLGCAGLEQHVKGFRAAIPDLELELERIMASDDAVVGLWTWTGTPAVEFFGVPPTGVKWSARSPASFRSRTACSRTTLSSRTRLGRRSRWVRKSSCPRVPAHRRDSRRGLHVRRCRRSVQRERRCIRPDAPAAFWAMGWASFKNARTALMNSSRCSISDRWPQSSSTTALAPLIAC